MLNVVCLMTELFVFPIGYSLIKMKSHHFPSPDIYFLGASLVRLFQKKKKKDNFLIRLVEYFT